MKKLAASFFILFISSFQALSQNNDLIFVHSFNQTTILEVEVTDLPLPSNGDSLDSLSNPFQIEIVANQLQKYGLSTNEIFEFVVEQNSVVSIQITQQPRNPLAECVVLNSPISISKQVNRVTIDCSPQTNKFIFGKSKWGGDVW